MTIKIGDVFFWSYKDQYISDISRQAGTVYWALDQSCVSVEIDGHICLKETYNAYWQKSWGDFSDSKSLSKFLGRGAVLHGDRVDLEYKFNLFDYKVVDGHSWEKYDTSDRIILAYHKGYEKLYLVKKDSSESEKQILLNLTSERDEAIDKIACYQREVDYLSQRIKEQRLKLGDSV